MYIHLLSNNKQLLLALLQAISLFLHYHCNVLFFSLTLFITPINVSVFYFKHDVFFFYSFFYVIYIFINTGKLCFIFFKNRYMIILSMQQYGAI